MPVRFQAFFLREENQLYFAIGPDNNLLNILLMLYTRSLVHLLAFAFTLPGKVASVFISISVHSITTTEPELRQTAKILGKPGFHTTFLTLTPA